MVSEPVAPTAPTEILPQNLPTTTRSAALNNSCKRPVRIIERAYKWGHPALAITDHGVAQAFPEAFHTWQDLWKEEKGKRKDAGDENPDRQDFFKIIYGVEGYLVDDMKEVVVNAKGQDFMSDFVVFDLETTGFSPMNNKIIEIGAVKISNGKIADTICESTGIEKMVYYPCPA